MTLLEEVLTAPRRASIRLPDTQVIEREGWYQVSTPSLRQGGLNEVALCMVPAADIERVIGETLAHYGGRRFRWSVFPGSKPDDLAERLEKHGMVRGMTRGMARDTTPPLEMPAGVEVERVTKHDDYTRAMAEGWEMDPGPLVPVHESGIADRRQRLYVARVGGELAGCASYSNCGTSAYFMGGVVLKRFRGRGIYRAMIARRLADAAAEGIPLAVTHAREETSAPMLAHLGFQTVCTFPTFINAPR